MVNEAHKRGMSVIFDFVPNHLHSRNVLQMYDGTNLYFAEGAMHFMLWFLYPFAFS